MAKGGADCETAQPVDNALRGCLPANRRVRSGCAMARKETRDADRPSNQLALPILAVFFVVMVVCIVIPFSAAVRLCTPCLRVPLLLQVLCQFAGSSMFLYRAL